jgi:hypothetical protein
MNGTAGVNATIAMLIGFGALIGMVGIMLVGTVRRAEKQGRKLSRGRASRAAPTSTWLPSLCHPLAVDATASEFDDAPRRRFIPVSSLSEPKEGEASASARSF